MSVYGESFRKILGVASSETRSNVSAIFRTRKNVSPVTHATLFRFRRAMAHSTRLEDL